MTEFTNQDLLRNNFEQIKKVAIKTGLALVYIATLFSQSYQIVMWYKKVDKNEV